MSFIARVTVCRETPTADAMSTIVARRFISIAADCTGQHPSPWQSEEAPSEALGGQHKPAAGGSARVCCNPLLTTPRPLDESRTMS
jgi:hypothetical protein